MPDDLADQAARLRTTIATLSSDVARLEARLGGAHAKVTRTVKRHQRVVIGLAFSVLLDFGLSAYVVWTNHRLNEVQQRTSNEVLCPLYGLLLGSYQPERVPPEKLAQYKETFRILSESREALRCR